MKIPGNKILFFFSLGLNAGFIIFLIFHLCTLPDSKHREGFYIAVNALKNIEINENKRNKAMEEAAVFNKKIKKIHSELQQKRMVLLSLYSTSDRDEDKINALKKDLADTLKTKDAYFSDHVKQLDSILGDDAAQYFSYVNKQLKEHFKKNKQ